MPLASPRPRPVSRPTVRPLSSSGGGAPSFTPLSFGFSASRDEGTVGDYYVDGTSGSDANPGTLAQPKATITGALAISGIGGKHIKVRAGTYRETVTLSSKGGSLGARTTISRYGNEAVIITAAEPITGWTQCGAGDATVLGSTLGVSNSPVYKKAITSSDVAGGDARAAHLYENGTRLLPAIDWLPNPLYPQFSAVTSQWHTSSATITSGGLITGYQLASVTSKYTTAQITNADVLFHYYPNLGGRTKVASFSGGTIGLTDTTRTYESNANKDRFALINILPAMKKGQWGFTDDGGGNFTLYVYPNSAANMTAGIEISKRETCIDCGTSTSHLEVRGLIIQRASSANATSTGGGYAFMAGGDTKRENIVIDNCYLRDTYRLNWDYAPIWMGNIDDWQVRRTTVENAFGQFGVFMSGQAWDVGAGMADGGRMDLCKIVNCENSPIRHFGQTNKIVSRTIARGCGVSSHANKGTDYLSCHKVLYWGVDFRGCSGYHTWQEASSVAMAFCDIPVNYISADGRAIVDQNYNSTAGMYSPATEQGINGDSFVLNCLTEPFKDAPAQPISITLGKLNDTAVLYTVKNNILNGATFSTAAAGTGSVKTDRLNNWKTNLLTSGSTYDASDQTATIGAVYTDYASGNVSIKSNSPSRSATTTSIAADIATLAGWFPDFDGFGKDMSGTAFNSASPPMGPYVDPANAPAVDPMWVEKPTDSGTPTVGVSLSSTGGYLVAFPWVATTYQWQRSTDLYAADDGWTDISGQTSASYTAVTGDIGYYLRRKNTAGTAVCYTLFQTAVAAAFPLADPVVLTTKQRAQTGSPYTLNVANGGETATFTVSNKPILVRVAFRINATDPIPAVTVGTPGRGSGGTTVTYLADDSRTSVGEYWFYLGSPGSGSVTVQAIGSGGNIYSHRIDVIELGGATGANAGSTTGTSSNSVSHSVATGSANTIVLHGTARVGGDTAGNSMTTTGATTLTAASGNSGGSDLYSDILVDLAWEQVASSSTATATTSWTNSASACRRSVVITS